MKVFCDALGLVPPSSAVSRSAASSRKARATRCPDHPGKLILLLSTAAKIGVPTVFAASERVGGQDVGAVAESYRMNPTPEDRAGCIARCRPFYRHCRDRPPPDPALIIMRTEVSLYFNGPHHEQGRVDFHDGLATVRCPVLHEVDQDLEQSGRGHA